MTSGAATRPAPGGGWEEYGYGDPYAGYEGWYGADPYGADPYGADPYGADPYGGAGEYWGGEDPSGAG